MLSFGLFWFEAFSLISVDGNGTLIFEVYFKNVNESKPWAREFSVASLETPS